MQNYNKRILLSVTGMSPAVVTETLYALVTEKQFIPTEIRVITTLRGKNKVLETLLGIVDGRKERKGALDEFIADYGEQYQISRIHFDESCIRVIEDSAGNKLSDICTPEENALASDQIVKLVGELCQDEESAVHVSIAGGRKTMGFFLGYALSLYGRKQDSLSHVLVSEPFESVRDFFYPKPHSHIIYDMNGKEIDAAEGKVMLAEIPWVRLGLGISEDLLNNKISYSDSVKRAQQILEEPKITFLSPVADRKVLLSEHFRIKLSPRGYALLLSLAIAKINNWAFGQEGDFFNTFECYMKIYSEFKDDAIFNEKVANNLERLERIFVDSQHNIRTKVNTVFPAKKAIQDKYIPSHAGGIYKLNVDIENIDISQIQQEIAHLL